MYEGQRQRVDQLLQEGEEFFVILRSELIHLNLNSFDEVQVRHGHARFEDGYVAQNHAEHYHGPYSVEGQEFLVLFFGFTQQFL